MGAGALIAATLLTSCATMDNRVDLIVSNITIYSGVGDRGFVGSVAIREGRFFAISWGEMAVSSADRVDGTGKFLVPGLWDMHVHLRASGGESLDVAEFGKHGITSVRDLGSLAGSLRKLQDTARANPHLPSVYSSIAALNGKAFAPYQRVVTESLELPQAIDEQISAGAVQIKIHRAFPPGLLQKAVELARARGLKLTGHIPMGIHPLAACEAGMDGIEHVGSFLEAYISVTPKATPQEAMDFMLSGAAEPLYRCLASRRVFVTPTLVLYPAIALGRGNGTVSASAREFITGTRRIVRRLHESGVPLLAGTDTSDVGDLGLKPGAALLDELESLQEAGIPPLEVLKIATGNAAAALGSSGPEGLIGVGQPADFVMLARDPRADVRALRSPLAVYRKGFRVPQASVGSPGMQREGPNAHAAPRAM